MPGSDDHPATRRGMCQGVTQQVLKHLSDTDHIQRNPDSRNLQLRFERHVLLPGHFLEVCNGTLDQRFDRGRLAVHVKFPGIRQRQEPQVVDQLGNMPGLLMQAFRRGLERAIQDGFERS